MKLTLSTKEASQLARTLVDVPLFSELTGKQIRSLAIWFAKERAYDVGETIVKEGDWGVSLFIITSGSVEIRRRKRLLSKMSRGQFFGEMALINRRPRSATVIAAEPGTKCVAMTFWNFTAAVEKDPRLAIGIMKELARRLQESTNSLSD